jgi:hypothetical protein
MKPTYQIIPFHKIITVFFLIAIVLFSTFHPGRLSAVQAQQGGTESLSGWFTIIRGDGLDGSTKEIHMLATDDGQSVALLLDEIVAEPGVVTPGPAAYYCKRGLVWNASDQGGPKRSR